MPITINICPSCQKEIHIDESLDYYFCSYCGHKIEKSDNQLFSELQAKYLVSDLIAQASDIALYKNSEEIETKCDQILKLEPDNYEIWIIKDKCNLHRAFKNTDSHSYVGNNALKQVLQYAPDDKLNFIKQQRIAFILKISENYIYEYEKEYRAYGITADLQEAFEYRTKLETIKYTISDFIRSAGYLGEGELSLYDELIKINSKIMNTQAYHRGGFTSHFAWKERFRTELQYEINRWHNKKQLIMKKEKIPDPANIFIRIMLIICIIGIIIICILSIQAL